MKWYDKLSMCGEMKRRGFRPTAPTHGKYYKNKAGIDPKVLFMYRVLNIPIVIGMKMSTPFAEFVAEVITNGNWRKV